MSQQPLTQVPEGSQYAPGNYQTEAAPQIVLSINRTPYRVKSVDTTVEINIEMIRGNTLEPSGWGITDVAYSGELTFHGDVSGIITPELTREDGITPVENTTLTISHLRGDPDRFHNVLMTEAGYSMEEESLSETTFSWVAMSKD